MRVLGFKGVRRTPTCSAKLLATRQTTLEFICSPSLSFILHIWVVCYLRAGRCCVRLPPAVQNPEKRHLFESIQGIQDVSTASKRFPRHGKPFSTAVDKVRGGVRPTQSLACLPHRGPGGLGKAQANFIRIEPYEK